MDVNNIIKNYVDAAILYGEEQEKGNAKKVNKQVERINNSIAILRKYDLLNNEVFLNLLYHENDYVKFHTAYSILHVNEKEALKNLELLSQKGGLLGFESKISIEEYKKGNI